jgi:hypothetical protein
MKTNLNNILFFYFELSNRDPKNQKMLLILDTVVLFPEKNLKINTEKDIQQ